MNEKLRLTLEKIEALAKQNPDFALELQKIVKCSPSAIPASIPHKVAEDIIAIREALSIQANNSISYDFVSHQRMRDQLIIDNLRMENARLDLSLKEKERYVSFCINAFYQVESIINYYFYVSYDNIQNLALAVEQATKDEYHDAKKDYRYKPTGKEKSVGDIPIACKINAFYNIVLPSEVKKDKVFMGKLKTIRNDYSHRGVDDKPDNNKDFFNKFYKVYTYDNIRGSLVKLVRAIKNELENPTKIPLNPQPVSIVEEILWIEGVISTKLPGSCFVKYGENNNKELPNRLFSKVKEQEEGAPVKLKLINKEITDVIVSDQIEKVKQ